MVKRNRIVAFFLIVAVLAAVIGTTVMSTAKSIKLGLDLQGGFEVLYKVKPIEKGDKIDQSVLLSTATALEKRVNVLGVSEPNIQVEGKDRIRVQLAGVKDQAKARSILSTEANLTIRDVNDHVLMSGKDLKPGGAKSSFDENGHPDVVITFKDASKVKQVTQKVLNMGPPNNMMVIWLDFQEGKDSFKKESAKPHPKYLSAASVNQVFTQDSLSIVGPSFTVKNAKELADLLDAGALPVNLEEMYSTSIGAKFGQDALHETIFAGAIGIAVIYLFMLFFYRLPGLIACIMLSAYLYLTLLVFDWMNAVLTLPGIAALILGVGIAVDNNIITYERIKDELKLGKSVAAAYRAGNHRSFGTIFDANITTLLAAVVLFAFGTSSVKGFATSLMVSIFVSFVTAVFGSRLLLSLLVQSRYLNKKKSWFSVKESEILGLNHNLAHPPTKYDKIDFVSVGRKFLYLSIVTLIVGVIILSIFKLNLGIDFASGTRVTFESNTTITKQVVQQEITTLKLKQPEEISISQNGAKSGSLTFKGVLSKDQIAQVKSDFSKKFGSEPNISTVDPIVGKELAMNALKALCIASLGIILYVSIRFQFSYAISAILALLHDAFFIVVFFSIFRLEVDVTFIAAVLTIVGYSINDSIVTFDRVRENMKLKKKIRTVDELKEVVNESIRQTLGRSVKTVLTVIVAVLALLIFGSSSITNFSIALLVGLVVGTYSSIFVASQIWLMIKTRELNKNKVIETVEEAK
ncbi:protein translocase subunit SecDF [Bacillus sp. RG28]|uniref:Multifunctional fusion protein n=1 Tax=Gottfriedia endophytica TaxID=2820819 RepID=A0A940SIH9_9BACI|nr:protein translocase subunit SecDF [Gottfriedia endophytica]MBP0723829.1 protein translocase subunit SecDF [Gottfriedia endophytica]